MLMKTKDRGDKRDSLSLDAIGRIERGLQIDEIVLDGSRRHEAREDGRRPSLVIRP